MALIAPPWVPVPPPAYGGTEAMIDTLARGLREAGHDVLLFTTGDSTCPVPRSWTYDRAVGVAAARPAAEVRHVIAAYEAAAVFDIVHDHTLVGPLYADRFPWLPVVTTNHGPFGPELLDLYQVVSDRAPVIAISHDQASRAQGVSLAGVIHHGVDVERFPVGAGDGGYALFLGRMSPDKGVERAVRLARLAGMPLRIAAKMTEDDERRYFAERIRPILRGDVEYVGEVGGAEKLELLGAAQCLLNPIAWPEPFGMVVIEAMACGTPVVGSVSGSMPELVADGVTGYLGADDRSLVRGLLAIAEIDRAACRERVRACFSAERMVSAHLTVYRSVIDRQVASIRPGQPIG